MILPPQPQTRPATGVARLAGLDGLRGLAALVIVVLHVWLYTTTNSGSRSGLFEGVVHEFRLALPMFFVLSGFLIYRAWVSAALGGRARPRLRSYAAARIRRLVPGAWACLLITAPLLIALDDVRGVNVPDLASIPLFAVFAQALHPETAARLNPPMWSLTVEASFYVVLPVLGAGALWLVARRPRRGALLVPAACLAVVGLAWNVLLTTLDPSLVLATALPALAPCFAAGMAAAVLAHGRAIPPAVASALVAAGVCLVVADGWWHASGTASATDAGRIVRDLPAAVGFAMVIAAVAHGVRPVRLLDARPLTWLGERSYGVYLWHMPVIYFLRGAGAFPEGDTPLALAMVLAVVVPIAHLSWTLIEAPALRWRSRKREHRAPLPGDADRHPRDRARIDVHRGVPAGGALRA